MTHINTTPNPMQFRIAKKQLWLIYLFPALFISDILYGAMDYFGFHSVVSPGMLFRGLAFLLSVVMVLKRHALLPRFVFWWVLVVVMFTVPGVIVGTVVGGNVLRDSMYVLRVLYGPFLILLFIILIRKYAIKAEELLVHIEYASYVLGGALLFSQYLGIQRATYGDYAFGSTGVFYAQNDLSLTFGLALLAASYRIVESFSLKRVVLMGGTMFACLQIGTKASVVVVLINAIVIVILAVWRKQGGSKPKENRPLRRTIRWLFSIILAAGMLSLANYGLHLQSQTSYQQQRIERIIIYGELPRSVLMSAGFSYLGTRAPLLALSGEGMTSYMYGVAGHFPYPVLERAAEVDWMDLFGAYGIIFVCGIHSFFLWVLFGASKNFLRGTMKNIVGCVAAALVMYLGHSMLAGHAMFSPIPTTLIAGYVAIYITMEKEKKGRMFEELI